MFRKLSKWVVLSTFNQGGTDYVLFCRKNLKTGMLYFKCKSASPKFVCSYNFRGESLVDLVANFEKILGSF